MAQTIVGTYERKVSWGKGHGVSGYWCTTHQVPLANPVCHRRGCDNSGEDVITLEEKRRMSEARANESAQKKGRKTKK